MRAMRGGLAGVVRRQEVGQASAALSRRERMRPVPRSGRPGSMPPTRPVTRGHEPADPRHGRRFPGDAARRRADRPAVNRFFGCPPLDRMSWLIGSRSVEAGRYTRLPWLLLWRTSDSRLSPRRSRAACRDDAGATPAAQAFLLRSC
jgi:hypothetical protein